MVVPPPGAEMIAIVAPASATRSWSSESPTCPILLAPAKVLRAESAAVVRDHEGEPALLPGHADGQGAGLRMLDDVPDALLGGAIDQPDVVDRVALGRGFGLEPGHEPVLLGDPGEPSQRTVQATTVEVGRSDLHDHRPEFADGVPRLLRTPLPSR